MEYEPLERLLLETKISNCQRSLPNCPESNRGLLLAMLSEARHELHDLLERESAIVNSVNATPNVESSFQDQA